MTESKRGRTSKAARAVASDAAAAADAPTATAAVAATDAPTAAAAEPAPPAEVPRSAEVEPGTAPTPPLATERATPPATTPLTLTIRLPFFTATLSGPQPVPAAVSPVPGPRSPGGTLEKLAFYGGVATMGALGAIEWPVALVVAAGTWVAQHTPPVGGAGRGAVPRAHVGAPEPTGGEPARTPAGV